MERMQKSSELSWIEVQFLKEAVETVVQCRNTLKWSRFKKKKKKKKKKKIDTFITIIDTLTMNKVQN